MSPVRTMVLSFFFSISYSVFVNNLGGHVNTNYLGTKVRHQNLSGLASLLFGPHKYLLTLCMYLLQGRFTVICMRSPSKSSPVSRDSWLIREGSQARNSVGLFEAPLIYNADSQTQAQFFIYSRSWLLPHRVRHQTLPPLLMLQL